MLLSISVELPSETQSER